MLCPTLSLRDSCFIWSLVAETSIIDVSGDVVGVVEDLLNCLEDGIALNLGTVSMKKNLILELGCSVF